MYITVLVIGQLLTLQKSNHFISHQGRMMKAGSMMISYQPLGELPNFFRSIISNQAQTEEDIDFMLDELDRLGHDL